MITIITQRPAMNKIGLKLLAIIPLFTTVLAISAHAGEIVFTAPEAPEETCSTNSRFHNLTCVRQTSEHNSSSLINIPQGSDEDYQMYELTEAESDAAVALYGCDCPVCINALRQLQS